MLKSRIEMKNGTPRLYINGREECAMAYTTYFEERSRYTDFIRAGYKIFFVNVSFTTAPINSVTGFTPFKKPLKYLFSVKFFRMEAMMRMMMMERKKEKEKYFHLKG